MSINKPPLVSVVIPCYNLGVYLADAIESVKAQTYKNIEIILVDDGSTDEETISVVTKLHRDKSLQVIRQKNKGLSEARNVGIRASNGVYIICLDADDKLAVDYVDKTLSIFLTNTSSNIGVVTTWLQEFGSRQNVWKTASYNPGRLLFENSLHAGSMFKKDAWSKVGGYKAEMKGGYEDWEFWLSLIENGYIWETIEESLFFYRIRDNSMLSTADAQHLDLYSRLVKLHPKVYKQYVNDFAIQSAAKIHDQHSLISSVTKERDAYKSQLVILEEEYAITREQLTKVADELDQLQLSRVTAPAIKLRRVLIKVRRKLSLKSDQLKPYLKKSVPRPIRGRIKRIIHSYNNPKVVITENKKWPQGDPLVTIVTPFYNQSGTVGDTISSVLNQTFKNFEYIIVNDGSSSIESTILAEAVTDPRIKIIHHKQNIGQGSPAAARNSGISEAHGKYIVCLDSDDKIDATYIEKCLIKMEENLSLGLVTTDTQVFGFSSELMLYMDYDPYVLLSNNMITTAAMFKKEAWHKVGGYKTDIGYEDWEFWISLAEHGYFGMHIHEPLFQYRTAEGSRYTEDKKRHVDNVRIIKSLHPNYAKKIKKSYKNRTLVKSTADTQYINLGGGKRDDDESSKKNILIAIPWMTFGGAETLIVNFCKEISSVHNLNFITGLPSIHEWEYKFKSITPNIYHLSNLFSSKEEYIEFVSYYIDSRNIDTLHIIHTDFMFTILRELKNRHPNLIVIVTMFNDRVPHYYHPSIELHDAIDVYTTDNNTTAEHYNADLLGKKPVVTIPNGIDCIERFNPVLFDRQIVRHELNIKDNDVAVFFIGRLSEEKNPDVFLNMANKVIKKFKVNTIKFFVIGDGAMRTQIEEMINKINSDQLQYLGYQENIERYLSAADIFVLPSKIEGFPLSILEAMAMKVVPIASNVGAVSDVIDNGKNGYVVTPGSAEEISNVIINLRRDDEMLNNIKDAARMKLEKNYSNTMLRKNYLKLYKGEK